MKSFECSHCKVKLTEKEKLFKCDKCGLVIWKQKAGYTLTEEDINELLQNGRTKEDRSFKKNGGGEFKTYLVINNNALDFGFNVRNPTSETQSHNEQNHTSYIAEEFPKSTADTYIDEKKINTINLRVHSESSGRCRINLTGLEKKLDITINFGIVASREAECLATITAVCFAKWVVKAPDKYSMSISMNNVEFSNYLLKEMTPKSKDMQYKIGYLWSTLKSFKSWNASLNHKKNHKLEGTNLSDFPRGVFPWIHPDVFENEEEISIKLPLNPAVIQQFKASFPTAVAYEEQQCEDEEVYVMSLPKYAEKALRAWVAVVKNI